MWTSVYPRERIGQAFRSNLQDIYVPDDVVAQVMESLSETQARTDTTNKEQRQKLEHRLSAVHNRMDEAYSDKLDGVISAEFWQHKTAEWEEQQILLAMQELEQASPDMLLTAKRTLELANKAYFLYVTQKPEDQAKLLKMGTFELPHRWRKSLSYI